MIITLDEIGYFLYMEEQEEANKELNNELDNDLVEE